MNCERCKREVHGSIEVASGVMGGVGIITMVATPDRDWICCDACNALVCEDCCARPESGYCDSCIASPGLYRHLVECGLIKEADDGK